MSSFGFGAHSESLLQKLRQQRTYRRDRTRLGLLCRTARAVSALHNPHRRANRPTESSQFLHRNGPIAVLITSRECDFQFAGCRNRILEKKFVKITQTEQKEGVWGFLLDGMVLPHHGGEILILHANRRRRPHHQRLWDRATLG